MVHHALRFITASLLLVAAGVSAETNPGAAGAGRAATFKTISKTTVNFAFGVSSLGADAEEELLAAVKGRDPKTSWARIEGYADTIGSRAANIKVSTNRANRVRLFLQSLGFPEDHFFVVVGKGDANPIASNETDEGRARNRRVEVTFLEKEEFERQSREAEKAGTIVVPVAPPPASEAEKTPDPPPEPEPMRPAFTGPRQVATLGITYGLDFYYPIVAYEYRVYPNMTAGIALFQTSSLDGATTRFRGFGASLTANYYSDTAFRGLWIQAGLMASRVSGTSATAQQAQTVPGGRLVGGFSLPTDIDPLMIRAGLGVQYWRNPFTVGNWLPGGPTALLLFDIGWTW